MNGHSASTVCGLDEVRGIVSQVEGWLTDREVAFLYKTARECSQDGVILEIGSWKGKSTICLAKGSEAGAKVPVYAVDPHIGTLEQGMWMDGRSSFEDFRKNISESGVEDLVIPLAKRSQDVAKNWDTPISFLWIDGDHSYAGAMSDFELFSKWVVEGGVIAFHDSTQDEVPQVVVEVFGRPGFRKLGLVDSITHGVKCSAGGKSLCDRFILLCVANYDHARKIPGIKHVKEVVKAALAKILADSA
jgi:predicted O-methyltransferase YrrM